MEKKSSNIKSDWFYGECVTSAAVHWWRRNNGAIAVNIGQLRVFAKRKAAVHTKERRAVCAARFGKLKKKNIRESKKKIHDGIVQWAHTGSTHDSGGGSWYLESWGVGGASGRECRSRRLT